MASDSYSFASMGSSVLSLGKDIFDNKLLLIALITLLIASIFIIISFIINFLMAMKLDTANLYGNQLTQECNNTGVYIFETDNYQIYNKIKQENIYNNLNNSIHIIYVSNIIILIGLLIFVVQVYLNQDSINKQNEENSFLSPELIKPKIQDSKAILLYIPCAILSYLILFSIGLWGKMKNSVTSEKLGTKSYKSTQTAKNIFYGSSPLILLVMFLTISKSQNIGNWFYPIILFIFYLIIIFTNVIRSNILSILTQYEKYEILINQLNSEITKMYSDASENSDINNISSIPQKIKDYFNVQIKALEVNDLNATYENKESNLVKYLKNNNGNELKEITDPLIENNINNIRKLMAELRAFDLHTPVRNYYKNMNYFGFFIFITLFSGIFHIIYKLIPQLPIGFTLVLLILIIIYGWISINY